MHTVHLRKSLVMPLPLFTVELISGFRIYEAEVDIEAHCYPPERETRDCPGSPPTAEIVGAKIRLPDGRWVRLHYTDDMADLFPDCDLEGEALEQAGQEVREFEMARYE